VGAIHQGIPARVLLRATVLILDRGLVVNAGRPGGEDLTPQVRTVRPDGSVLVDGRPQSRDHDLPPVGTIARLPERFAGMTSTGPSAARIPGDARGIDDRDVVGHERPTRTARMSPYLTIK